MELDRLTGSIDDIDAQLAALFVVRMELLRQTEQVRKQQNLADCEQEREQETLRQVARMVGGELEPYAERLFCCLFQLGREYCQTL